MDNSNITTKKPSVAFCMAAYNCEAFVSESLESIHSQTGLENYSKAIFICDDCSTDKTVERIKESFNAKGWDHYLLSMAINSEGVCAIPKNLSIGYAIDVWNAEYIVLMDADDKLEPEFTSKAIKVLEENSDITWVTSDGCMFGDRTGIIKPVADKSVVDMYRDNGITSWCVIRASKLAKTHGYRHVLHEDYDLWIRLLRAGYKYHIIREPLYNYRVHKTQKTNTIDQDKARQEIIDYHFKDTVYGQAAKI